MINPTTFREGLDLLTLGREICLPKPSLVGFLSYLRLDEVKMNLEISIQGNSVVFKPNQTIRT